MRKLLLLSALFLLAGCAHQSSGVGAVVEVVNDISAIGVSEKYNASEIKSKYQLEGSVLKREVKADQKDRIEVTIGNTTLGAGEPTDFSPDLTISRWDEVSFTLKPKGLDIVASKDKNLSFENDRIKFSTPKVDYEMYELPVDGKNTDGAFEYEIILKEKPATNVVEFQIETQGLDFFYQSELTQEETDRGDFRPENVVGSYAVYASEKKINYTGGKEYKAGKVGHIYRPKIIDNVGNWTWGTLNIDKMTGILSVGIPQDFLDNAVYPVIVDPTLGYTVQGGTAASNRDFLWSDTETASSSGTINAISAYMDQGTSGSWHVARAAIYVGDNGFEENLSLLTNSATAEQGIPSANWYKFTPTTSPTITASEYLVTTWGGSSSALGLRIYGDAGDCNDYNVPLATYSKTGVWPQPQTFSGQTSCKSIYVSYNIIGNSNPGANLADGELWHASGPWVAPESGTIYSMSGYFGSATSGNDIIYAVYADSAGTPGSLLAQSSSFSGAAGWNTSAISTSITSGTSYWLAWGSRVLITRWGMTGTHTEYLKAWTYPTVPSPYGAGSATASRDNAIYANYTVGGGAAAVATTTDVQFISGQTKILGNTKLIGH